KEQWETAFDALSEGIAVVDDHGCISRANRALAAMLGAPIAGVIGCNLGEALLGPSPALLELLVAARAGARVQPVVLRSATLGRTIRVNAARIPAPAPAHDESVVVLVEDVTDQQVLGDRHALQQVVINLLNNAAQAVADNPPERPRVILLSTWVDDRVRMRVSDSGAGIADAVLPHLFTPFFTTKEPGQGTGLGLSITYSIVEAHGGRIKVERPAEGGAAFLVDLPPAPLATDAARRETAEPAVAPPATKRSILLVDD